jgi:CRP-like cAMP-binding protein
MSEGTGLVAVSTRDGLRNRTLALRGLGIFEGVDDEGLALAAEYATVRSFARGEIITVAGDPLRSVHVVIDGQITVTRRNGRAIPIRAGHGVGLLDALANETEAPQTVADVDTRTLEIPVEGLLTALDENFTLLRGTLRHCAAGILRVRGNLPARPDRPPVVHLGTRTVGPRTLAEKVIDMSAGGGPIANANVDALFDIARATRDVHVEPGHVFWRVGDPSAFTLRITYGRVRCSNAEGHVDIGSEFALGVMDAIAGQPHSYEARAVTEVIVYETEFEDFLVALESHPEVLTEMLANLARALLADA